jgi:hypothetical protein
MSASAGHTDPLAAEVNPFDVTVVPKISFAPRPLKKRGLVRNQCSSSFTANAMSGGTVAVCGCGRECTAG